MTDRADRFEVLVEGLVTGAYGMCDHFIDDKTVDGLRNNILKYRQQGEMHRAGIGRHFDFQLNTEIRGDLIRWIDPQTSDPFEQTLLSSIGDFIQYLNRTCFTAINGMEFHYAYYEKNSYYKKHLDQFQNDRGRVFSLVIYLNKDWDPDDGGKLTLSVPGDDIDILPYGGRAVFFRSDQIEHEVHPSSTRHRLSIAGWLKNV